MKTLAVLSDTHGNLSAIERVLPILESVDYVVHLGDCNADMKGFNSIKDKLITVKGNCDFSIGEKTKIVDIEGKRLLFTHGDMFGVKSSLNRICYFAEENKVDAVFYGHTHEAFCESVNGILFVNPGAMARMQVQKSFAYVTVCDGKILCNINRSICL